jgi:membrane protease YdiL (CAAX protease family)
MRRIALFDVALILGTAGVYVALEALSVPKRWSFAFMGIALLAYGLHVWRRGTDSWFGLGFRTDNLRAALVPIGTFTLIAAAGEVAFALAHGRSLWRSDLAFLLLLYPVWGIVQQAVFQGLLHRRLMVLIRLPFLQVFVTALAFAAVHAGNPVLLLLTFPAGLAWSALFRRWPNLWLLGLSHAFLAALTYPLVLGAAPLSRL